MGYRPAQGTECISIAWKSWAAYTGIAKSDYLILTKENYLPAPLASGPPATAFAALAKLEMARARHDIYRDARALTENALRLERRKGMRTDRMVRERQLIKIEDVVSVTAEALRVMRGSLETLADDVDRHIPRRQARQVRDLVNTRITSALEAAADKIESDYS